MQQDSSKGVKKYLVRIPSDNSSALLARLIRVEGAILNAVVGIIHFLMIVSFPIFLPAISFLAFSTMTWIQPDVYSKPLTMEDFFIPDKMDPWWHNIPKA